MYMRMHGRQSKPGRTILSSALPCTQRRLRFHRLGLTVMLLMSTAIATSGAASPASEETPGSVAGAESKAHPELWPAVQWPLKTDPAIEERIRALLAAMTLEEKVAPTVQADIGSITTDESASITWARSSPAATPRRAVNNTPTQRLGSRWPTSSTAHPPIAATADKGSRRCSASMRCMATTT